MPIINFIFSNQITLGMLLAALFYMPWNQLRDRFYLRFGSGLILLFAISIICNTVNVESKLKLLIITASIYCLIWLSFKTSFIHNIFYTTCAYCVQHISSKLTYMIAIPIIVKTDIDGYSFSIFILTVISILSVIVVYFKYTKPFFKKGNLQFDNAKIVLYSGVFIFAAVYLSAILEDGFDQTSSSYLTSYICLNAFCILFSFVILALEFSNLNIKQLEQENHILAELLESDKQQYEQAQRDMEKINIRYHDLKQQYTQASEEERVKLDKEMASLSLRYLTGNKAVDITLTQKCLKCNDLGIQLICSADAGCLDHITHFHLYSILGNALDNAIECLENVSDHEKKVIMLDIHKENDMAIIKVENYTPHQPVINDGRLVTTKSDATNHGYGVKSIQNTAELYGGNAHIFVENEVFYLVVALPISSNATAN